MLNLAGRLQITNAVLSALPTFYMCTLELPKAVIKQIDKFQKAWEMVCRTKNEGGLGIINLELQNQALLMKNLDKFYNKKETPWVNLVWEKHYKNDKLPGAMKKGPFGGGMF